MPSLYDRIARRLEDGRDEYDDFESDVENGRRNRFGMKTRKWHDHESECQRESHKHKTEGHDPKHRENMDRRHDRAHPKDKHREHGRSRHLDDTNERHVRGNHAHSDDRRHGPDSPEDRDRRHQSNHPDSSRGIKASDNRAERNKRSSRTSNTPHPHLRKRDVLIDVAGKFIEDLLGGSTRQPEKNHKHRRRHRHKTNGEHGGKFSDSQRRHRARTPERMLAESAQQEGGAPPTLPRDHGEAESYYQGHPLQHQRPSSGRPQGPPSNRQPYNAPPQSHGRTSDGYGPPPPRSSHGPRSGAEPSYQNNKRPRNSEERGWKAGSHPTGETGSRSPKTKPWDSEGEQSGDEDGAHDTEPGPHENGRRPRGRGTAPHEIPSTSSARDFGRPPKTGKSPQETATSTSINGDSDREDETDRSSVGSKQSSLMIE